MQTPDFRGAVCADHPDPDMWHDDHRQEQAINACRTGGPDGQPCPRLEQCLIYATDPAADSFTRSGVWGGLTPESRARIRARRLRSTEPSLRVSVPTHRAHGRNRRYQTVTFTAPNCQTPVQESSL